ncbi:hypothetical protein GIB67_004784 [Kingdonia uniflora]|uniref:Cytochrome P450 n=1 Tax=Kingdonia uniflora TaxID=39325 RepID=A0A7J7LN64_9MAGN|nr:hypothetical protein GIB67_004784 [Kingdonia uniflora]
MSFESSEFCRLDMKWILGFGVLIGTMGYYWWKKSQYTNTGASDGKIPKGSLGWPLIGETLSFIACGYSSRPVSFMEKRRSLYGKVFKSHLLGRPIIVSTDPDVNKVVLQNNGSIFIPYYPKSITELLGKSSILQMNGSLQKRVHGLIGGFLRSPQLKAKVTKQMELSIGLSMNTWKDKKLIYIQEETRNIAFEVLVKVLMSVNPGEDLEFFKREYREFIKGLICFPIKLPGSQLYKSLKAKERLLKLVRNIVEEKKFKLDKEGKLDTIKDVVEVLLCDAGEDGNEIQRLPLDSSEENMELKRRKIQLSQEYVWTDYISLPFTQNVINETLRMGNIINAVWRKALKDIEIKGYLIPKEWCVLASFGSVHMDDKNYENPCQFDPWRWQKKQEQSGTTSKNFTPFGGGQRLCPGLELSRLEVSIFLHHLVTRYRWMAEEDFIVNFPTVKMKHKMLITVTPIST